MPHQLHTELRDRIATHAWLIRQPLLFPLLVFALVVLAIIAGAVTTERAERESERQRLNSTVMEAQRFVRQVETTHIAMLRGSSLFLSRVPITEQEFEVLAGSGLHSIDVQVVEGIGWAEAKPGTEQGTISSAAVTFLAPNTPRNQRAIGFQMYGEAHRRAAIDLAVATRSPAATAPIVLAQEEPASQKPGFLLYTPVIEPNGNVKGLLYAAYNGDRFIAAIASRLAVKPQYLAIEDVSDNPAVRISEIGQRNDTQLFRSVPVNFGGRQWRIGVGIESSNVLASSTRWILLIGLIIAGLALMLAMQFVNAAIEERRFYEWQASQLQVRDTLMLELNHRVKNTLANVLSIITLTRRKATDIDSFAESLSGRVRALSATHDILTAQQWASATLESVVRAELAPYLGRDEAQAEITGPEIILAPNTALSLGLAIHELATNAAKYGALSDGRGKVQINWAVNDADTIKLDWQEVGGPSVNQPDRSGFGTNLLRKTVSHELGRDVVLDFAPEGLRATLYVPVRAAHEFNLRQGRKA